MSFLVTFGSVEEEESKKKKCRINDMACGVSIISES